MTITQLVDKLYAYTRNAPMTAQEHTDALTTARELLAKFAELSAPKEDMPAPVAEKLGTEPKVV